MSTLRLIGDPALRRAIASYYTAIENVSIPLADMRDRIWAQYDARVANVLGPRERLGVLQSWPGSFGQGITSDAIEAADAPSVEELIAALRGFPGARNRGRRGPVPDHRTAVRVSTGCGPRPWS